MDVCKCNVRRFVYCRIGRLGARATGDACRAGQPSLGHLARHHGAQAPQALASGQAQLLEFVATGAALPLVLERLARFVEEHGDDLLASILLLDRDGVHLRHGAAPSLPEAYCTAIDGAEIGPSVGSCGTAAYAASA